MKRSPLKRKTPMRRTNFRKASKPFSSKAKGGRKRIRQDGKRRDGSLTTNAQYKLDNKPDRDEWAASMPKVCMGCGSTKNLHVHEISRRGKSPANCLDRCNYLLLCDPCNCGPFNSIGTRPHAMQLAIKKLHDPENFKLEAWLQLRDPRAMDYVTMDEIQNYSEAIENGREAV